MIAAPYLSGPQPAVWRDGAHSHAGAERSGGRAEAHRGRPGNARAMLPSMGLPNHLGSKEYWPIYQEAERLGCALAIHGGCHSGMGLDHLNVYAPIHAMGHPMGIMIGLAGIVFNGIFDRFPNIRIAFLEGGVAWFLMAMERFDSSHLSHSEYQIRDDLMGPKMDQKVSRVHDPTYQGRKALHRRGRWRTVSGLCHPAGWQRALPVFLRLSPRGYQRDLQRGN